MGLFDSFPMELLNPQHLKEKLTTIKDQLKNEVITEISEDNLIEVKVRGDAKLVSLKVSEHANTVLTSEQIYQAIVETTNQAIDKSKKLALEKFKNALGPLANLMGDLSL